MSECSIQKHRFDVSDYTEWMNGGVGQCLSCYVRCCRRSVLFPLMRIDFRECAVKSISSVVKSVSSGQSVPRVQSSRRCPNSWSISTYCVRCRRAHHLLTERHVGSLFDDTKIALLWCSYRSKLFSYPSLTVTAALLTNFVYVLITKTNVSGHDRINAAYYVRHDVITSRDIDRAPKLLRLVSNVTSVMGFTSVTSQMTTQTGARVNRSEEIL